MSLIYFFHQFLRSGLFHVYFFNKLLIILIKPLLNRISKNALRSVLLFIFFKLLNLFLVLDIGLQTTLRSWV